MKLKFQLHSQQVRQYCLQINVSKTLLKVGLVKLANCLKEIRKEHNQTQEALGDAVGETRQTIIAIENGKFGPTVTLALALAQELDAKVENLFWLENE